LLLFYSIDAGDEWQLIAASIVGEKGDGWIKN